MSVRSRSFSRSVAIAFGAGAAITFHVPDAAGVVQLTGNVFGSNALTKTGAGTLRVGGLPTYTGSTPTE